MGRQWPSAFLIHVSRLHARPRWLAFLSSLRAKRFLTLSPYDSLLRCMNKPTPSDFCLSDEKLHELEKLDSKLRARIPLVLVAVFYISLVFLVWDEMGWFSLIAMLPATFLLGMMAGAAIHSLTLRLFFGNYSGYLRAREKYNAWLIRTQKEFWERLTGRAFEIEVARLLNTAGYKAQLTPATGDKGVAIFLGDGTIVQCKAHKMPTSPGVVRELYGTLRHMRAPKAILISTSGFTSGVHEFIRGKPIQLWDANRLIAIQKDLDK